MEGENLRGAEEVDGNTVADQEDVVDRKERQRESAKSGSWHNMDRGRPPSNGKGSGWEQCKGYDGYYRPNVSYREAP